MSKLDNKYRLLIEKILLYGDKNLYRNGEAYSLTNQSLSFDLSKGFPIISLKKIFYKKAIAEFIWFISGTNSIKFLKDNGVNWWDEWADDLGNLKKSYGYQLRKFNSDFDQLEYVIKEVNEGSRRAHISLWNPSDLKEQNIPCCYTGFDFVVQNNRVDMVMNFRSSDVFLGLPYDIIVGALLLMLVADRTKMEPGIVHYNLSNAHIYEIHKSDALRVSKKNGFSIPKIKIKKFDKDLSSYGVSGYKSNEYVKTKLIV